MPPPRVRLPASRAARHRHVDVASIWASSDRVSVHHAPQPGPPRLPFRVAVRSFPELCAPLRLSTASESNPLHRFLPDHVMFTGSRILSNNRQVYLKNCELLHKLKSRAWMPDDMLVVMNALLTSVATIDGKSTAPVLQRDDTSSVEFQRTGLASSSLHVNCGRVAMLAPQASTSPKAVIVAEHLVSRLAKLGAVPSSLSREAGSTHDRTRCLEDVDAAAGFEFCADFGFPISATGKPYLSPLVVSQLRSHMHHILHDDDRGIKEGVEGRQRYRSPYWIKASQMSAFGVSLRGGSTPVRVAIENERRGNSVAEFYNAEQTSNPCLFNAISCNTTLEPVLLPGMFFGPTYRPPSGGVTLWMSWMFAHDPPLFPVNVWVDRNYLGVLRLTYNGKFTSMLPSLEANTTLLAVNAFLNYEQIVEQERLSFYVRYVPVDVSKRQRIFGLNGIKCAKAAYAARVSNPFWAPWNELASVRSSTADEVEVVLKIELTDPQTGKAMLFCNVVFSTPLAVEDCVE